MSIRHSKFSLLLILYSMVFVFAKANASNQEKIALKPQPTQGNKNAVAPAKILPSMSSSVQKNNVAEKNKQSIPLEKKLKPRKKYIASKKKQPVEFFSHFKPKKDLVVVGSSSLQSPSSILKQKESAVPKQPDTADFDESEFAAIDFSDDHTASDYYHKKTLLEVKKEIANTKKNYILYFGANWCVPCRMMRETVFKAHDVKKYLNQYHITYVDIDNFDGMDIKEMYNVTNIPSMVIINTKGKQIARIEGSITSTRFSEKLKTFLTQ